MPICEREIQADLREVAGSNADTAVGSLPFLSIVQKSDTMPFSMKTLPPHTVQGEEQNHRRRRARREEVLFSLLSIGDPLAEGCGYYIAFSRNGTPFRRLFSPNFSSTVANLSSTLLRRLFTSIA